jgi:hypothetical protein
MNTEILLLFIYTSLQGKSQGFLEGEMDNVASFIIACFVSLILGAVIMYAYLNHDGRARGIGSDLDELGDNLATVETGLDSISGRLETGASEVGAIASGLNEPVRKVESVVSELDQSLDDVGRGKAILEGIRKRAGLERD